MNYDFLVLQCIGIILVVSGHLGFGAFLADWFPYYSFHIPLFVFISGYFYKSGESFVKTLLSKAKKLVLPYFYWNIFYGLIATILMAIGLITYGHEISFTHFFIDPWFSGHQFGINVASWFVLAIFITIIAYTIIRKCLLYLKVNNEYLITVLFIMIGLAGNYMATIGYNTDYYLILSRTMFLMPFLQIGYLYKNKLEIHDKLDNISYFLIIMLIQLLILYNYSDINFIVVHMIFPNKSILLPLLTSLTGIMFWLRIAKIISKIYPKNKVVEYVGKNTWTIMMHHQFVFLLINLCIYTMSKYLSIFKGFNFEAFKTNMWYAYAPKSDVRFFVIYLILGMTIPLLIKELFNKIKFKDSK